MDANYAIELNLGNVLPTYPHEFILNAVAIGALTFPVGGRELKSKRISPYFFNSGKYCDGESLYRLAGMYAEKLTHRYQDMEGFVLYGPAYKGIALANVVATYLFENHGVKVFTANNRKETKDHGEGGLLMGTSMSGRKVIIIEDVITDGASKREAVKMIRADGGDVVGCVISFDRQERGVNSDMSGAEEFEKEFKVPLYSLAGLDDLIDLLETFPSNQSDNQKTLLGKLINYRTEYGGKF